MKTLGTTGIWLLAAAVLLHSGWFAPTLTALGLFYYCVLVAALLLAWRFHSSRVFFALLVIFLSEHAITFFSAGHISASGPGRTALAAVGVLLPFNLALLSLAKERGVTFSSVAPASVLLFAQSVVVAVLCRPGDAGPLAHSPHHSAATIALPFSVLLAFAAGAVVLLVRFILFRKPIDAAFVWVLAASFLALEFGGVGRIPTGYFATAVFVLGVSIVETSYLLAFQDELTTLPSRRAFNDALLRLEAPFSIAMVDIDHFKRCNDTYGHDIGDQVLRMVAAKLARVSGGGQAYRCGGEEFAVVFPGKSGKEVVDDLEQLRAAIEAGRFRLRGRDRREIPRGAERRTDAPGRGRSRRRLAAVSDANLLAVTASIGVASCTLEKSVETADVVKAADQALYRAKAAGRNRVEVDAAPRRRARARSAGIA
jgi:GGDEF domain-containing protein